MPESLKLRYVEAINVALRRSLEERVETILFGEDVGEPGGVFGATRGLRKEFGRRVFDTPISESAILGGAVGAAMMGRRPIVEIMWIDFTLVALDQIVNQAANVRYVSEGRLNAPLTIRTQQGALPGSCAQHSQNLESIFTHIPGIYVCVPATAQDAYDLLLSAVWSDDPVIVIENRGLYFGAKEVVQLGGAIDPVGGARVVREGSDVTVVSWGAMVHQALAAAEQLAGGGVSVEVIDARWLVPFDTETVLASVEKTRRVLIAHEANVSSGFGAEVSARVTESGFHLLDAPPLRVGLPDVRVPAAPGLQAAVLPNADTLARGLRELTSQRA